MQGGSSKRPQDSLSKHNDKTLIMAFLGAILGRMPPSEISKVEVPFNFSLLAFVNKKREKSWTIIVHYYIESFRSQLPFQVCYIFWGETKPDPWKIVLQP